MYKYEQFAAKVSERSSTYDPARSRYTSQMAKHVELPAVAVKKEYYSRPRIRRQVSLRDKTPISIPYSDVDVKDKIRSSVVGYMGHCPGKVAENVLGHTFTVVKALAFEGTRGDRSKASGPSFYPSFLNGHTWFSHERLPPCDKSLQPVIKQSWDEASIAKKSHTQ
eukprot:GHVR01134652.1.p1 GENE.GHVR01134652.1~~GHVR01134652.1.p1  ORF type:complete len:166 (+),score=29.19 GHVR01134652.1:67-564(+)